MDKISILIVDDEPEFSEPLSKRLGHRGLEVCIAASGQEALKSLDASPADIVLLDVKMPGMGGLEVLHRIKASHPLVEVILLTGHADLDSSVECLSCGAFGYLLKPVDMDSLLFKIQDAHKYKSLQSPATATGPEHGGGH